MTEAQSIALPAIIVSPRHIEEEMAVLVMKLRYQRGVQIGDDEKVGREAEVMSERVQLVTEG